MLNIQIENTHYINNSSTTLIKYYKCKKNKFYIFLSENHI